MIRGWRKVRHETIHYWPTAVRLGQKNDVKRKKGKDIISKTTEESALGSFDLCFASTPDTTALAFSCFTVNRRLCRIWGHICKISSVVRLVQRMWSLASLCAWGDNCCDLTGWVCLFLADILPVSGWYLTLSDSYSTPRRGVSYVQPAFDSLTP